MDENARKIEKVDERQRQLELLNVKMQAMLERHDDDLKEQDSRIFKLENKRLINSDKFIWIIITVATTVIITSIFEYILKLTFNI